jgi:hypothetical protein
VLKLDRDFYSPHQQVYPQDRVDVATHRLPYPGSLRDELLNGEIFYTLTEAKVLIESWRHHYNEVRPHSSLNYQPPASRVITSVPEKENLFSLSSSVNEAIGALH